MAEEGKKPQVFLNPSADFLKPNIQSPAEDSSLVFTESPASSNNVKGKVVKECHNMIRCEILPRIHGCARKIKIKGMK